MPQARLRFIQTLHYDDPNMDIARATDNLCESQPLAQ